MYVALNFSCFLVFECIQEDVHIVGGGDMSVRRCAGMPMGQVWELMESTFPVACD